MRNIFLYAMWLVLIAMLLSFGWACAEVIPAVVVDSGWLPDKVLNLPRGTSISRINIMYPAQRPQARIKTERGFVQGLSDDYFVVDLDATESTIPAGATVSYYWQIAKDGKIIAVYNTIRPRQRHVFNTGNAPERYTVTLAVTDNQKLAGFSSTYITIPARIK